MHFVENNYLEAEQTSITLWGELNSYLCSIINTLYGQMRSAVFVVYTFCTLLSDRISQCVQPRVVVIYYILICLCVWLYDSVRVEKEKRVVFYIRNTAIPLILFSPFSFVICSSIYIYFQRVENVIRYTLSNVYSSLAKVYQLR